MREIRTKVIHLNGQRERVSEQQGTRRGETWIESDTTAVHTIMHGDGDFTTVTYRRAAGETEWVIDSRVRGGASCPTRLVPRSDASRQPVACRNCGGAEYSVEGGPCPACGGTGVERSVPVHSAADNYLGT